MKIEHVDGGPFTLTLSHDEAALICYTVPSALAGYGGEDHPAYMEFLRLQKEVLSAGLVPGSKDSSLAYSPEQAKALEDRIQKVKGITDDVSIDETCPVCGSPNLQRAATPGPRETQEGSA